MKKEMMMAAALAVSCGFADTITVNVAQGATYDVTTLVTASVMEVHGTLRVRGNSKTDVAELTIYPKSTAASLGTAAGDNAVIDIGDYGRIGGGQFTIGGPGGVGGFVVGGKRKNNATDFSSSTAHLVMGHVRIPVDAANDAGVIDILTLNAGASAGTTQEYGNRIINASTNVDARILFNGGYYGVFNAYGSTYMFTTLSNTQYPGDIPSGAGGKAIILESVNGNPIDMKFIYGGSCYPVYGTVRFRGTGDVRLDAPNKTHLYGWQWNQTANSWQHTGDLITTGSFRFLCYSADGLPCAPTNGIVRVLGNEYSYLDMRGKNQKVNGLIVSGGSVLSNNTATAVTLTFGAAKPDGVMSVREVRYKEGGEITAVKQGEGTLTVTNTPYFPAMRIEKGTVHFKDDDCTLDSLTVKSNARVIVDGCTLTVKSFSENGSVCSCVNGGRLLVALGSDENEKLQATDAMAADVTAITKVGSGTTVLHQSSTLTPDVHVQGGTLALARLGTTNHWFRFSFTAMYNNENFQLSEMMLMDANGNRVDGGGSSVGYASAVTNADFECAPKDMLPKSVWASDQDWLYATTGYFDLTPSALFDGRNYTRVRYSSKATPENPKVFVVRMPETTTETCLYNFRIGYSSQNDPTAWTVETSPDGINWTQASSYSGVTPPTGVQAYYNYGVHYPFLLERSGAAGISASANVQVDRGATLDCSRVTGGQTLSNLTVDCAAGEGVGTLVNVAFAAAGTINLVNLPAETALDNYELPLAFTDVAATENVRDWAVSVNGASVSRKLSYRNGRFVFIPAGTIITAR